jgi:hypothetical protein
MDQENRGEFLTMRNRQKIIGGGKNEAIDL